MGTAEKKKRKGGDAGTREGGGKRPQRGDRERHRDTERGREIRKGERRRQRDRLGTPGKGENFLRSPSPRQGVSG